MGVKVVIVPVAADVVLWGFADRGSSHERFANEPSPKLLIKDHKKVDKDGNFPTRLVVPANNFTSAFPKLGYMAIRKILDDSKVDYMSKTIIQASDLKKQLEGLNINNKDTTIVSIDAKEFYPSVRFKLVKKAVYYFAKGLNKANHNWPLP